MAPDECFRISYSYLVNTRCVPQNAFFLKKILKKLLKNVTFFLKVSQRKPRTLR